MMSDYFCHICGGRTGMMGHGGKHNMELYERINEMHRNGWPMPKAIQAVGEWQIGERGEPMSHWTNEALWNLP